MQLDRHDGRETKQTIGKSWSMKPTEGLSTRQEQVQRFYGTEPEQRAK